jgi:hypothetical protein
MRRFTLSLVVVLAAAARAGASGVDEAELEAKLVDVTGFRYTRARKGPQGQLNWVRGYVKVRAAEGAELEDVRVSIDYVDYSGKELISAGPKSLGSLTGGRTTEVELSAFRVPIFNGYVVHIECRFAGSTRKVDFYGSRTSLTPFRIPEKPYPRSVQPFIMAHELERGFKSRGADLYVRVRNLGAVAVKKLHATIQLLNDEGRPVKGSRAKARTLLYGARGGRNGEVRGGEERLFVVKFRSFPQFENYSVALDWETPPPDELLSGGEFEGGTEVEVARFRFERKGRDGLGISAEARNGLATDIRDLKVDLSLYLRPNVGGDSASGEAKLVRTLRGTVPGVIPSGEVSSFTIEADGIGEFNDFGYEIAYGEPGEATTAAAPASPGGRPVVTVTSATLKGGTTLVIEGEVENATSAPIKDFRLTFHLNRTSGGREETVADVTYDIRGVIAPGESVPFIVSKKDCPRFDGYLFETSFAPAR